jgi:high-affinity iron transporter
MFNAAILSLAVVMLTWHNVWMSRHGREMAAELKATGQAVTSGSKSVFALSIVVGVAVLREGAEVVLFLYGIAVSDNSSWANLLIGGIAGLAAGALFAILTYVGLLKISPKRLFAVTSALIAFLVAGMAAQATAFLEQADVVTLLQQSAWDSSGFLSDKSIAGRVLHTLIGYNDQPSYLQLMVYLVTLVIIFSLMRVFGPAPRPRTPPRRLSV